MTKPNKIEWCETCHKRRAKKVLTVAKGTKNEKAYQLCPECYAYHKYLLATVNYHNLEWWV